MRNGIIIRKPNKYARTSGNYTHITKIPRNAELFVSSGQIGINQNTNSQRV